MLRRNLLKLFGLIPFGLSRTKIIHPLSKYHGKLKKEPDWEVVSRAMKVLEEEFKNRPPNYYTKMLYHITAPNLYPKPPEPLC